MNDFFLISQYSQETLLVGIACVLIIGALCIPLSVLLQWKLALRKDAQRSQQKKQQLSDLVEMKEIQGELEKEMRESLIKQGLLRSASEAANLENAPKS
jgi:hypothetical protein